MQIQVYRFMCLFGTRGSGVHDVCICFLTQIFFRVKLMSASSSQSVTVIEKQFNFKKSLVENPYLSTLFHSHSLGASHFPFFLSQSLYLCVCVSLCVSRSVCAPCPLTPPPPPLSLFVLSYEVRGHD